MNSEELKARTKQFALRVMKLVGALLDESNALTAVFTAAVRTSKIGRNRR